MVDERPASGKRVTMIIFAAVACALLGALGGCDLDLIGAVRSGAMPIGMIAGGGLGLLFGILVGAWQARYDSSAPTKTPSYAGPFSLGSAFLALSIASFFITQKVPGLRPLVIGRAPVRPESGSTARLAFTADATAPLAVVLALQEDPTVKALKGFPAGDRTSKAPPIPPRSVIRITSDPPGAYADKPIGVFHSADVKLVEFGRLEAEQGKTYKLTATVASSFPTAPYWDPHVEAQRSLVGWSRAFPRMVAAGLIGLFAGVAGIVLLAYGGVLRYTANRSKTSSGA